MDRLVEIIGPAPSEMLIDDLLRKLSAERDRVRESLDYFAKYGPIDPKSKSKAKKTRQAEEPTETKKGGRAKAKKEPTLVEQAKAAGLSEQQLVALLAKMQEEKDATND